MSSVEIGTLIVRSPEIRDNRPRVAGTGVTVQAIAGLYRLGLSAEEIRNEIPHLTLAQVYAALVYYHANRGEIDASLERDEDEALRIEAEHSKRQRTAAS